jgi:diguanylate cyclase (GGDEF)-like protein
LDVDHFKKFNDQWGHDVGDQVLRRVATALAGVSGRGRAFRYGGEEFAIVFPHDDLGRAGDALETVRARIADTPFRIRGQRSGAEERGKKTDSPEHTITVSAGLARGEGDAAVTFKRADDALYKAKKKGRNRLVRAD